MKDDTRWILRMGIALVILSLALYIVLYLIFHDTQNVMFSFVGNLAFIPLQVLFITLIMEQMLESRERKERMEKLNMVIGTFFSTTGTPLLALLIRADPSIETLRQRLVVRDSWRKNDFAEMKTVMGNYECSIDMENVDLETVRDFLLKNEDFLLRLVENPMVFEHESFTDLILAISHLTEELKARDRLTGLPKDDAGHLAIDLRRVYSRLIPEWLRYMEYLQDHYPYLFHLAMRKNPFDASASVIIGRDA